MKLWLISQSENNGWDTFDSAVVAAETEEAARHTYPTGDWGNKIWNGSKWLWHLEDGRIVDYYSSDWVSPDHVEVQFLADGYDGPAGVILGSFNAG